MQLERLFKDRPPDVRIYTTKTHLMYELFQSYLFHSPLFMATTNSVVFSYANSHKPPNVLYIKEAAIFSGRLS